MQCVHKVHKVLVRRLVKQGVEFYSETALHRVVSYVQSTQKGLLNSLMEQSGGIACGV